MNYDWNTGIRLEKKRTNSKSGYTKFIYKPFHEFVGDPKHRLTVLFKETADYVEICKTVISRNDEDRHELAPHHLSVLLTHIGTYTGKQIILPALAKL